MNYIIIALVLVVLAAIVIIALMKRAKNDPESFVNPILEHMNIPDEADELYDVLDRYINPQERVSRAARPKIPSPHEYKKNLAAMEERSRKAQEELNKQDIEDLELWEEGRR